MPITFVNAPSKAQIITHGGKSFHGDDIFGMALLELLYGNVTCFRLPYDYKLDKINKNTIIFDTRGGHFDHHQKGGNGLHPSIVKGLVRIPYASFGLLWEAFGREIIKNIFGYSEEDFVEYIFRYVDFHLVRGIDAADSGIFPVSSLNYPIYRVLSLSCVISLLNPDEIVNDDENEGLEIAVKLANKALNISLNRALDAYYNKIYCYEPRAKNGKNQLFESCITKDLVNFLKENSPNLDEKRDGLTNYFSGNCIEHAWNRYSDGFCKAIYDKNTTTLKRYLSGIVYGFCADSEEIAHLFSKKYDDMDVMTLESIFFSKEEYGEEYEKDLAEVFKHVFKNYIDMQMFKLSSKKYVESEVKKQSGHILVLRDRAYWQDWIANMPEAKRIWFIVMPTESGTWKVKPVPCKYKPNGYRKGFPFAWYGYRKEAGDNSLGIEGVSFIHNEGFLAICETLESAIQLSRKAYERER